ncbi:MAG: hypothetical protein H0U49_11785, partial [Parachlamydiaceae bacterium]|nr:hypothetical protein [Parachlamydiaceae bacterium]
MNVSGSSPINQDHISLPTKVQEAKTPHTIQETKEKTADINSISHSMTIPKRIADAPLSDEHSIKKTLKEENKTTSDSVNKAATPRLVEKKQIRDIKEEIKNVHSEIENLKHENHGLSQSNISTSSTNSGTMIPSNQLNKSYEKLNNLENQLKTLQETKVINENKSSSLPISPVKLETINKIFEKQIRQISHTDAEQLKEIASNMSDNSQNFAKIGEKKFFISITRNLNNTESIEIYERVSLLGDGSFGKVHSYQNLDTGDTHAMKLAKTKAKGDEATEDVKAESEKLFQYNPRTNKELKVGIQEPPHIIVNAIGKTGYMGVKYEGSGRELFY